MDVDPFPTTCFYAIDGWPGLSLQHKLWNVARVVARRWFLTVAVLGPIQRFMMVKHDNDVMPRNSPEYVFFGRNH